MGSQKSTWEVKGQHWKSAPLVFSERVIQARIGSFRNTRYINPQKGQSRFFGYKSSPLVHLLEHLILGNNFHPDPPPPEKTLPCLGSPVSTTTCFLGSSRLEICQKIYTTKFSGKIILHTENA